MREPHEFTLPDGRENLDGGGIAHEEPERWLEFVEADAERYGSLSELTDARRFAVHVGAGPSLDLNGHLLGRLKRPEVALYATDGAYPWLNSHGIVPDYVITSEETSHTCKFFEGLNTEGSTLLCSHMAYPGAKERWAAGGGRVLQYVNWMQRPGHITQRWVDVALPPSLPKVEPCRGTVICHCMQIAHDLGVTGHVMVGCDWGQGGDRLHCEGYRAPQWRENIEGRFKMSLSRFLEDLERPEWAWLKTDVVNATEGGVLELNNAPLRETLDSLCLLGDERG